ncbi:hypothetical protein LCGC14_0409930 [marine sediment metagenome]|uniref:DNA N-6-adenine-methyltransferase (Dam) n=1 Tax=marine sediment metagenome TaxID=412755 RepID=A0A0F9SZS4_9ZZZZ
MEVGAIMSGDRGYILPSQGADWETPRDLFDELWAEFNGFDLDPCGTRGQYTVERVLDAGGRLFDGSVGMDGLARVWDGKVFMNPPYGKGVGDWIAKAAYEVEAGNAALVVGLLKATTDVKWWHEYVEGVLTPRFIKGRLKFGGQDGPAPFPSVILVWRLGLL